MYRKKIKKRDLTPLSLREPSPVENRVRIRRDIIDELDVIKIRIDQVVYMHESIVVKCIHIHFRYYRLLRKRAHR